MLMLLRIDRRDGAGLRAPATTAHVRDQEGAPNDRACSQEATTDVGMLDLGNGDGARWKEDGFTVQAKSIAVSALDPGRFETDPSRIVGNDLPLNGTSADTDDICELGTPLRGERHANVAPGRERGDALSGVSLASNAARRGTGEKKRSNHQRGSPGR